MTDEIDEKTRTGGSQFGLVVVGSSAGGIEALSTLVSGLPASFSLPIVIAQHLDPSRESHLEEILARKSALPVRTVTEHEPLRPGVVSVVPANHHVSITDSEINLKTTSLRQPKPSVDLLLSSAAEAFGEGLIAVILTGTGKDGSAGAAAVAKAGGTVIIQNPETAEYPGMPLSLAPSTVDIVAELERIGQVLQDLPAGIGVPAEADGGRTLETLLETVREYHGVDFTGYKMPTILRRLQRRVAATGSGDVEGYSRYLDEHPEEYQQLINSFLIKVTEFFRDTELFEHLRLEVLPKLIEENRGSGNELRLWSAGCATGEESYSLAITVAEALGDELSSFNVRLFATDIDESAVNFARNGTYSRQAVENVPEHLLERYFEAADGEYQINALVRGMVVFGKHDLGQRAPFPRIDMVLSRNVLIYFTPELQRRALDLFAHSLRDGGRLVLGKAESVSSRNEYFDPENREQKVFRRRGERFILPAPSGWTPASAPASWTTGARKASAPSGASRKAVRKIDVNPLRGLPVGVVIAGSRYDIRFINGAAQQMLSIHSPAVGEDLIHLLRGAAYTRLRPAIDAALTEDDSIEIEDFVVESPESTEPRYLKLVVQAYAFGADAGGDGGVETPLSDTGDSGTGGFAGDDSVMIIVDDVTAQGRERDELRERLERSETEFERVNTVNQRLTERNGQLERGNRELTRVNEELHATNEDLSISTEEAQAATEEVETLNEELQATNEELETLNEELQATIEELNTTSDDQRARDQDLQSNAREGEMRQRLLGSVLESLNHSLIVVDPEGGALLRTAAYQRTLGDEVPEFLREDGTPVPAEESPGIRAARGEKFVERYVVVTGDGYRWYEVSCQPLEEGEAEAGGALVFQERGEARLES